jgi:hypothetical protein
MKAASRRKTLLALACQLEYCRDESKRAGVLTVAMLLEIALSVLEEEHARTFHAKLGHTRRLLVS